MFWIIVVLVLVMLAAVLAGYWIGCADAALTRHRVHDLTHKLHRATEALHAADAASRRPPVDSIGE
jgi:hypothetical protein